MKTVTQTLRALTLFVFTSLLLISCGGKEDPQPQQPEDPCANTDLALTASSEGFAINATATGGESPYTYSLDGGAGQSSGTFTELAAGTYTVTVEDANECSASTEVEVIDPCANYAVTASGSAFDVTLTLTAGEAPFTYSYSNGGETVEAESSERTIELTMAAAEATTFTLTDANGCELSAEVTAEALSSFTDSRDGQTYEVVKIGQQIWFAENFKYNSNLVSDSTTSWYYDNDSMQYAEQYGRLYTWFAAKEIAPEGWSLPSTDQWAALETFLGTNAGTKLKVDGNSGFEAELGGSKLPTEFVGIEEFGNFWTITEDDSNNLNAVAYYVSSVSTSIFDGNANKVNALSIRFIKD